MDRRQFTGAAIASFAATMLAGPGKAAERAGGRHFAVTTRVSLPASEGAAEAFLPLALSEVRGGAASAVGIPLTAGTLCWTVGSWIQAREAHHRSRASLAASGVALVGTGILLVAAILRTSVPVAFARCDAIGSAMLRGTDGRAARCTIAAAPSHVSSSAPGSRIDVVSASDLGVASLYIPPASCTNRWTPVLSATA